jgi:hypothetical protein
VALTSNAILRGGTVGEFDLGVRLELGALALTPTVGISFDFAREVAAGLTAPRLITVFDSGSIYFESWLELTLQSPFDDAAIDLFHTRNFLLFAIGDSAALGPQVELDYRLNQDSDLASLPVGAQLRLNYGERNQLSLFLGYDLEEVPNSDRVTGRITFVRHW